MIMINLPQNNPLYTRTKIMTVKFITKKEFSPKDANAVIYSMFGDVKYIRDIHSSYKKPFAIKNLNKNSFDVNFWIDFPENAVKERALKWNLEVNSITYNYDYPIPNLTYMNWIVLKFTSPTAFNYKDWYVPYLEPRLFWGSTYKTWSQINGSVLPIEIDDICAIAHIMEVKTKITEKRLFKNIIFKGFVGEAVMKIANWAQGDLKLILYILLESAKYTGVGSKTAWGMGNMEFDIHSSMDSNFLG